MKKVIRKIPEYVDIPDHVDMGEETYIKGVTIGPIRLKWTRKTTMLVRIITMINLINCDVIDFLLSKCDYEKHEKAKV